jgi:cysteine desulfuration protein SufE
MGLQEKRQRLIDDMSYLPDRYERFTYVVDYAKDRETIPDDLRTDTFKVEGCQSQLWLVPEFSEGTCQFRADSDSAIVKGIATIICDFYSGETPEVILDGDVSFLEEVGIDQHLSSNRRNGLGKVDERIKRFAQSCLKSSSSS